MSILTPSRGDVMSFPHHRPHQHQASAIPLPPPAVSPRPPSNASTSFALPSKMDGHLRLKGAGTGTGTPNEPQGSGQFDVFGEWKRGAENNKTNRDRDILASINTNVSKDPPAPSQQRNVSTSKPSTSTRTTSSVTSIPRPAATPDVFFSPDASKFTSFNTSRVNPNASIQSLLSANGKRSRDISSHTSITNAASTSASTSFKRVKVAHDRDADVQNAIAVGKNGPSRNEETEKWRVKWVKSFPTLVFHFEIGAEEGAGKLLRHRVLRMGAKVDQFFSTRVTHLVVRGGGSPQKPKAASSRRGDLLRESPKNPFLDGTGVTDLAQKAEAMNIKVWTLKKLAEILSRIAPVETTTNDSLSTLLEDEKVNGTRERDLSAPRPDYYYFQPGSKYLLVEDATGRHRTIMVKEYGYDPKEGPEWPVLGDAFLRVSSSMQSNVPPEKVRERAWSLYVERRSFEGELPPQEFKRSTSLRALPVTPKLPEAQPYYQASGNSVVLTSNIASTSTANNTPIFGGLPSLGANKDRAIMQMSKRVQVLKGNARLAAAKRNNSGNFEHLLQSPSTTLPESKPVPPPKTFMTQEQVVKMLRQAREPMGEENISVQKRIRNRDKVEQGLAGREQDLAAGYCENCRLRYSDLSVHVASKKHRRFAMNNENFEDLDRLLYSLQRPLHPDTQELQLPPCYDLHDRDADCVKCNPQLMEQEQGITSEEEESSGESADGSIFEDQSEDSFGEGDGDDGQVNQGAQGL